MPGVGTRIVVAEQWAILRRGLAGLLQDLGPVDEVDHPHHLAGGLDGRDIEVVVVGDAPGLDLLAVVTAVVERRHDARVVALCDRLRPAELRALLRAGARGVLAKSVPDHELLDGVRRVLAGERVVDQRFLPLLFDDPRPRERVDGAPTGPLTPREHQVLVELARGASNRQIAEALVVGESTVKSHLESIFAKLDVGDRHRAVGRAIELGLLG